MKIRIRESAQLRGHLGGGTLGEGSQEDDDHGDHPVVEELRQQQTVTQLGNNILIKGQESPEMPEVTDMK